jgi:hypothetical protein
LLPRHRVARLTLCRRVLFYGVGGITEHGRTPLVVVTGILTGKCYRDEIVQRYVIPFGYLVYCTTTWAT